ncbi:hypothetical protein Ancab_020735 [Ancistrocladus abbreviatus]
MRTTKSSSSTSNGLPLLLCDIMYWHFKFLSSLSNLLTKSKFWPFYTCPVAEPEKIRRGFNNKKENRDDDKPSGSMISMAEVKFVMGKLGMCVDEAADGGPRKVGLDEFKELFEVEEPSFEEIKEAFDVFDENRDGSIDAVELNRVLCRLGLKEWGDGSVEQCGKMIGKFDENGDGVLDFNEFVKCLEKCLC